MPQAAVPSYIGQDFNDAPPGHRFGLYFSCWQPDWTMEPDPKKAEEKSKKGKLAALKRAAALDRYSQAQLKELRQRQQAVAATLSETVFSWPATSIAPFMTGTGMEHPLENGFAFLNPYGLPYLPGSGVKGVLRRAAEELVSKDDGDPQGWNQHAIDVLFGRETEPGDTEIARNRGALMFWDVIPEPAGDKLAVDIMTPHYSDYYQGNTTPHDSGQPNPILFLAIPPGSRFEFFVQCESILLPEALRQKWRTLLEAAFRHAFDWLGFGAKTAVGYGQLRTAIEKAHAEHAKIAEERRAQAAQATLSPEQKILAELQDWFKKDQAAKRKEPGGRLAMHLRDL
ncbi:MAG: type III-B CRISPR module RAMP protein Cmr6 [Gammaproteobacteria bacterium]|nr:type III-B CRISPR module RAMP protein Cmr6 [Gammaproteobacteria bacterium]